MELAEVFAGFGCFLLWTSIIGNLQNTQFYVVWRTFERAAPLVIRVALGVMPFFAAFLMIGVACFSVAYMELGNFANGMMFLVGSCIGDNLFPFYTPIA